MGSSCRRNTEWSIESEGFRALCKQIKTVFIVVERREESTRWDQHKPVWSSPDSLAVSIISWLYEVSTVYLKNHNIFQKKQIQTSLIWAALWNEGYRWLPNGLEDYWKAGRLIALFIRLGDLGWKKARLSYAHLVPVCACQTPQVCKSWALLSDLIPLPNPSLLRSWKALNLDDVAYRTICWVLLLHHLFLVRTPIFLTFLLTMLVHVYLEVPEKVIWPKHGQWANRHPSIFLRH